MRNIILSLFCYVLLWCEEVRSQIDNEVKRGVFPYMAVLYYPDETVVDSTGARFQHGAVLIKLDWLLSSAIDHSVLDGIPLGFPRKTLLARAGAMTLDANYTLNEDEDEQEREIIQIIKPSTHDKVAWWLTDITLLGTLVPFKTSSAVAPTSINLKQDNDDKKCTILVYARKAGHPLEDKTLMQLSVELLPPSVDNCGAQFNDTTMACAMPDAEKNAAYEWDFCQGNSGGPLICEGEVMALQTYIENNCKPPHLYQLLASWDTLITCGIDQKCGADAFCDVCVAIHKDMPSDEADISPAIIQNDTTNIQNDITVIQNETETTELSIAIETISSERTSNDTDVNPDTNIYDTESTPETTESFKMTVATEVMSAETKSMPQSSKSISLSSETPERTELPRSETAEVEAERRHNFMEFFKEELHEVSSIQTSSEKVLNSSGSENITHSKITLVEYTQTPHINASHDVSLRAGIDTVSPKPSDTTKDTADKHAKHGIKEVRYELIQNSSSSIIPTLNVLLLLILACLT